MRQPHHRYGNHDQTKSTGPLLAPVPVTCPVLKDKPAVAVRALRPTCLRRKLQPDPGVSPLATIAGHAALCDLLDLRNLGYHAQSSVQAPDETPLSFFAVPMPVKELTMRPPADQSASRNIFQKS